MCVDYCPKFKERCCCGNQNKNVYVTNAFVCVCATFNRLKLQMNGNSLYLSDVASHTDLPVMYGFWGIGYRKLNIFHVMVTQYETGSSGGIVQNYGKLKEWFV